MRRLVVLTVATLSMLAGPAVGSAAAATEYGPFAQLNSCTASAGNLEMHGYIITSNCRYISYSSWKRGYFYSAYRP